MIENPKYNICLIGSGGVGTIVAVVLEKSGQAKVTAVLRSRYEIVKEKGWDIDSVDHGVLRGWRPSGGTVQ
jgi:ketopantoate reductase